MKANTIMVVLLGGVLLPIGGAAAGTSDWAHFEGGSVRFVTAAKPDPSGVLAGALDIRLKPGWKTYWRDPGAAGVPPQASFSAHGRALPAQFAFPAPQRFDDGYAVWAGYGQSVSFPISIETGPLLPPRIEASLFMGICEKICIPVQASLSIDAAAQGEDELLATAWESLPAAESSLYHARLTKVQVGVMTVEAVMPDNAGEPELFVDGRGEHTLGVPELVERQPGRAVFHVPILSGPPADAATIGALPYTLVNGDRGVSGELQLDAD